MVVAAVLLVEVTEVVMERAVRPQVVVAVRSTSPTFVAFHIFHSSPAVHVDT